MSVKDIPLTEVFGKEAGKILAGINTLPTEEIEHKLYGYIYFKPDKFAIFLVKKFFLQIFP
jgi:hypothetical protein